MTASRSGPFFVQGVSHALKVRIMAPVEVRIRRVMVQSKLDQKAAAARVHAYDREMSGRIDYLFAMDWTDPAHYDLVVNTHDDAWDFYTDLLVMAARQPRYHPTPASLQKVRDLSLAARVRATLAVDPATRYRNIEVTAQAGQVRLTGIVFTVTELEAAAVVVRGVPGVVSVSCEKVDAPIYSGPIL